jgi:hypothetical protein
MITDEPSKAVQEVAKTTGKFAEITEKVGGFVSKVIGGASNQVGGILEDWTRYYRYKNLLSIADKVERIHAKRKILGKTIPIPPRVAIPMLESASLEDDDALQEVWARLIANSTDPNFKTGLHPGYIEVIKQLSPDDGTILNSFIQREKYPIIFSKMEVKEYLEAELRIIAKHRSEKRTKESFKIIYDLYQNHCKTLKLKCDADSGVYFDNLMRLRIIEVGYIFSTSEDSREVKTWHGKNVESTGGFVDILEPEQEEYLRVTSFGQSFIAACIADNA